MTGYSLSPLLGRGTVCHQLSNRTVKHHLPIITQHTVSSIKLCWLVHCRLTSLYAIPCRLCKVPSQCHYSQFISNHHHNHNRFTALFLGPPGWAGARKELLDFMVQGKINRGRHADNPAGRHSFPTKQCPSPSSPIFYRPFLPPNQQKMLEFSSTVLPAPSPYHWSISNNNDNINNRCLCIDYCLQCFDTVGWAAGRASGL